MWKTRYRQAVYWFGAATGVFFFAYCLKQAGLPLRVKSPVGEAKKKGCSV